MANRKGPHCLPCGILRFKGDMKGVQVHRAPAADGVDVVNWARWEPALPAGPHAATCWSDSFPAHVSCYTQNYLMLR